MLRFRVLPLLAPAFALALAVGCQKNTIELETDPGTNDDDDDDDSSDPTTTTMTTVSPTDDGPVATDDTGPPPPGTQLLLLAIDTVIAPGLPLQAVVNLTAGTGTVDLTLQFLSLDQGSTTSPRQPVGDVYAYAALPVDGTGTFYWDTGVILIPGAANPITGSDLVVSIQANVVPVGTPAYCGPVGGLVTSPIEVPLDGSTHAMTAISEVTNLPLDFAVDCP
jgi:hypothetical protein